MKSRMDTTEIVVGLDIGTTKVSAVVGEVDADGITILGVGNVPCRGLRKGVVSNIDWTVRVDRGRHREPRRRWPASRSAPSTPASPGATSASQTSDGVAAIAGGEVTRADVDRVLEGARAIPVDADRQILHVLPREFMVDNQDGIRDPIGMSGVRLGVKVNLVTAATTLRAERRPLRRALRPHRRRRRPRAARERRGRALARTRRRSASPSSTSAAARPTSSSTSTAASRTRASSPSAATTSRATSPRACARRWPRPSG